ncbi:MAG TPA: SRPBCC domain-containing protein [Allosphingosinicella sp.]|nr:SRPBCC domain-containing protein [Allosphingosinicella sp.]
MSDQAERRLEMERHYDAPRALVFAAWTEPERMKNWWGPAGWTIPFSEADLRAGGAFRYAMRSPEGDEHIVEGKIARIDPPGRYVTVSELGGDGAHPPVRVVTTVTFEEQAGGTLVRIVSVATAVADVIDSATEGMDEHTAEHLGRLGDYLESLETERSA